MQLPFRITSCLRFVGMIAASSGGEDAAPDSGFVPGLAVLPAECCWKPRITRTGRFPEQVVPASHPLHPIPIAFSSFVSRRVLGMIAQDVSGLS